MPRNLTPGLGSALLLNRSPIEIGGFVFHARGVQAKGRPRLDGFRDAVAFATAVAEGSAYWVGDLLAYAETREDWKQRLDQVLEMTGHQRETAYNLAWLCRRVDVEERTVSPSVSHSRIVAALEPRKQRAWLEKAATEGWSKRELTSQLKAAQRKTVIEGQAVLAGQHRVIYAAPPWSSIDIETLCKLPVAAHALPDAALFLWVPAHLMLANPGPREVIEAWGFTAKTHAVWDRVFGGFGGYWDIIHEDLVLATRGAPQNDAPVPQPTSIYRERRAAPDASEKPEEVRRLWIEKLYTTGPYLELFGSTPRKGWTVLGNDPRQWGADAGRRSA